MASSVKATPKLLAKEKFPIWKVDIIAHICSTHCIDTEDKAIVKAIFNTSTARLTPVPPSAIWLHPDYLDVTRGSAETQQARVDLQERVMKLDSNIFDEIRKALPDELKQELSTDLTANNAEYSGEDLYKALVDTLFPKAMRERGDLYEQLQKLRWDPAKEPYKRYNARIEHILTQIKAVDGRDVDPMLIELARYPRDMPEGYRTTYNANKTLPHKDIVKRFKDWESDTGKSFTDKGIATQSRNSMDCHRFHLRTKLNKHRRVNLSRAYTKT